jgi:hypothetical protein
VTKIVASGNRLSRAHIPALLPLLRQFTMLVEADFSHNSLRDDDVVQILGVLVCFRTIGIVSFDDNCAVRAPMSSRVMPGPVST